MNTGTQAAKEAGNMVDLDSDPTKLIEIVEIGKQLLMTRGALTTFSVANDLAKYFTILPAMLTGIAAFQVAKGDPHSSAFWSLNIMQLGTPSSATSRRSATRLRRSASIGSTPRRSRSSRSTKREERISFTPAAPRL
jgi:high-affinity K+ transport system ATPase subunit B